MKNKTKFGGLVAKIGKFSGTKIFTLLVLLVILIALFGILSGGSFFKLRTISTIIVSMPTITILTVGAACLLISGQMDLSMGAVATVCSFIFAILCRDTNIPLVLAAIISLLIAALIGFLNATLINQCNTPAFITTLATSYICQGVLYILVSKFSIGNKVKVDDAIFNALGQNAILNGFLPIAVIIAFAIYIAYGVLMSRTKFGKTVYLVGGNSKAAYLSGIHPKKVSHLLFVNSAVMGGVAGLLYAAKMGGADQAGLLLKQMDGMTAAILGGISFGGGSGGMLGAFIGLLLLGTFNTGITRIGISTYWQSVASGGLLLIALSFDFFNMRRRGSRKSAAKLAMTTAAKIGGGKSDDK